MESLADDGVAFIKARRAEKEEMILSAAMRKLLEQITEHGFALRLNKIEPNFPTRKRIETKLSLTIGTYVVETRNELNNLGVTLDKTLYFWLQIKRLN